MEKQNLFEVSNFALYSNFWAKIFDNFSNFHKILRNFRFLDDCSAVDQFSLRRFWLFWFEFFEALVYFRNENLHNFSQIYILFRALPLSSTESRQLFPFHHLRFICIEFDFIQRTNCTHVWSISFTSNATNNILDLGNYHHSSLTFITFIACQFFTRFHGMWRLTIPTAFLEFLIKLTFNWTLFTHWTIFHWNTQKFNLKKK